MELIHAFGIDYKILIAQALNFAILFFVLYRFGYKPIFAFLEERKERIRSGVVMAEKAEAKLRAAQEEKNAIVIEAKKEAGTIVANAYALAELGKEEKIKQAKEEIASIITKEKEKMLAEKEQMTKEIKADVADMIASALEKILGEKIDAEKDKAMIKEMMLRK